MQQLRVTSALLGGKSFTLAGDYFTIGRNPENTVRLEHSSISKQHAMITVDNGDIKLWDLHSTNGVIINGQKTVIGHLKPGDRIVLGDIELIFEVMQEAPAPVAKPVEANTGDRDQTQQLVFTPPSPKPAAETPVEPKRPALAIKQAPPAPPAPISPQVVQPAAETPRTVLPPAPAKSAAETAAEPKAPALVVKQAPPAPPTPISPQVVKPSTAADTADRDETQRMVLPPIPAKPAAEIPVEPKRPALAIKQAPPAPPAPISPQVVQPVAAVDTADRAETQRMALPPAPAKPAVETPVESKHPALTINQTPPAPPAPVTSEKVETQKIPAPIAAAPKLPLKPAPSTPAPTHTPVPKPLPEVFNEPALTAPSGRKLPSKRVICAIVLVLGLLLVACGYGFNAASFKFLGIATAITGFVCLVVTLRFDSFIAPPFKH